MISFKEFIESRLEDFVNSTKKLNLDDDIPMDDQWYKDKNWVEKYKEIKRIWNTHADHNFFNSLNKIHWVRDFGNKNPYESIAWFLNPVNRRNEVSASGYKPGESLDGRKIWGNVGVKLIGRVTLACNDMDKINSGLLSYFDQGWMQSKQSSGMPRYPSDIGQELMSHFILDEDSYDSSHGANFNKGNELFVDNWRVTAIIFRLFREKRPRIRKTHANEIYQLAKEKNIPVIDFEGRPIPENIFELSGL